MTIIHIIAVHHSSRLSQQKKKMKNTMLIAFNSHVSWLKSFQFLYVSRFTQRITALFLSPFQKGRGRTLCDVVTLGRYPNGTTKTEWDVLTI